MTRPRRRNQSVIRAVVLGAIRGARRGYVVSPPSAWCCAHCGTGLVNVTTGHPNEPTTYAHYCRRRLSDEIIRRAAGRVYRWSGDSLPFSSGFGTDQ